MIAVEVEMDVFGGYSDQPTGERASMSGTFEMAGVPRVGEQITPVEGWASSTVKVVFWGLDGSDPLLRLAPMYTLSGSFDEHVAALEGAGWSR